MAKINRSQAVFHKFAALVVLLSLLFGLAGQPKARAQSSIVHPVILIHGFNSTPSTWDTDANGEGLYDYLIRRGYRADHLVKFAYPPGRGFEEDTRGDIYLIAAKLVQDAEALSALSLSNGGPEKVDIIAHSLGGLITRQYLADHFQDHKIGAFIDIATPHGGSSYIDLYNKLTDEIAETINPFPFDMFNTLFKAAVDEFYSRFMGEHGLKLPDPNTPAGQQLDPDSDFMQNLNQPGKSPPSIDYNLLYGDATLRFRADLFGWETESQELLSMGDTVVARKNATTIPHLGTYAGPNPANYHLYNFDGPVTLKVTLALALPKLEIENYEEAQAQAKSVWHGGLIRNQAVFDKVYSILEDSAGNEPVITPIITTPPPAFSADTSTVLVLDSSGSMDEQDASGSTKLEAAKHAGERILDILEAEGQASSGVVSQIGLVRFSSVTEVLLNLTNDIAAARVALNGLSSQNMTGMPDGLQAGISVLESKPHNAKPIIILLSDGLPNVGLGGSAYDDYEAIKGQVIDLATQAGGKGICVFTVGFGTPGVTDFFGTMSIDEEFLRNVAHASGCGEYYNAQNATQLANVYVELRHTSTGEVLLSQSGEIAQDQQLTIAAVDVPAYQSQMLFTLNWPGSELEAVLVDPSGQQVNPDYPGASFHTTSSLSSVIVKEPLSGSWQVQAKGIDVPAGKTTYNAVLSVRPSPVTPTPLPLPTLVPTPIPTMPASSGFPIAVLLLVLGAGTVGIYMLYTTTSRKRAGSAAGVPPAAAPGIAQLLVLSGLNAGQSVPLYDGLVIGRSQACGLFLADASVSRQHAVLRYSQGGWFIQDQASKGGTYINGQRLPAARLKAGDRITIGSTTIEFRG
jgi:pimeloyl-ACP methyl ester carboxylesterase/uncharacterized protein YegL